MRQIFIFLNCLISAFIFSQSNCSNNLRLALHNNPLAIHTLLVKGNITALVRNTAEATYTLNYSAGDIASVTCNLQELSRLIEKKIVTYAELIQARMQVMNDTMRVRNRIEPVKTGAAPLSQAYDGTGILVGILDTGIDFNHPDFKDSQGNTRIRFLWDQNPTSGSSVPQPYNYGIEWTSTQINANQCTHNDLANFGHGTHVSGVAAGNGMGNGKNAGVASGAEIVAVALNLTKPGPTVADAVQYIFSKATALGKPCVINASLGDYYGSHDATDLQSKLIENMVKNIPGRAMVAAAGNAGSIKYHVKTQPSGNDTLFTWLKNSSLNLEYWCYADTMQIKGLQMSIGANRLNYSNVGNIGFKNYNYALNTLKTDTLYNVNHQKTGIIQSASSINNSGVYELYVQIAADSNFLWRIDTRGQGLHNAWNFDFVSNGLPNNSQLPQMVYYVKPDTLMSMVSGFQCSDEVITVANYHNLRFYYDVNNTLQDNGLLVGEISGGSSLGPTRDGRQKPEIAATGQFVFSTIPLTMLPNLIANAPLVVGQGSLHVRGGGTSVASPVVAGLVALYLQKNPTATNTQIKSAVTNCAFQDQFTGTALPDYQWGYGKLDGKATMLCGASIVNILAQENSAASFGPNPFQNAVNISLGNDFEDASVSIYNTEGKLLHRENYSGPAYLLQAEKLEDYHGLILLRIDNRGGSYNLKLIRE